MSAVQAVPNQRPRAVLVIGEPLPAEQRAYDLRKRGHATWVITAESELRWLLEQALVRATCAVIELSPTRADRAERLAVMASLAAAARVPCLLVGATAEEARLFTNVTASLPSPAAVDKIVDALPAR